VIERVELAPGYSISRLIHGGWQFSAGHRPSAPELDDAIAVLTASAEIGVTTFDCADIYTGVEELYGRFLQSWKRSSLGTPLQVHTKFVPDDSHLEEVDRGYVERIVDRSLRRLGVDVLDLVQFHWWRDEVPGMEQTALWLQELRCAGKIRYLAATNLDAKGMRRLEEAGVELVADQVQYSALDQRAEAGLTGYALQRGIGLLCYGGLAGGFLSERWSGREEPTELASRSLVKYRLIIDEFGGWERYQALLEELTRVAANHGAPVSAVALRLVMDQPAVAAVVCGATRLGQMAGNAEAFRIDLSDDDHARIRAHLGRAPGPSGPVFALERDRSGPHGRIMRYDLNRD
jgi:aryl-alcohol dehydrogenase-like predicted oxidoreductase